MWREVYQNLQNINSTFFSATGDPELWQRVADFFEKQDVWMRAMIEEHIKKDPFWEGVALIVSQFDGLTKGYEMSSYSSKNEVNSGGKQRCGGVTARQ